MKNPNESNMDMNALYDKIKKEIREEISKVPMFLNSHKVFEWEIKCDLAFDFEYYFTRDNPGCITEKIQKSRELKQKLLSDF